jgi:cellulose biosynthesis protein BcsQ
VKIYAVTNIKGGVGKTTTAVNLAYLCAAAGTRTLLWDLDSQGGATYVLRGEPQAHASAKKLLAGKRELPELIAPTGYPGLELLPADFSYRNFAVQLAERRHPTERLLKMSRSLRQIYGALFLDCPAGMSLLSENVLRAADVVIVPLVPSPLSIRMLRELYAFVAAEGWSDLRLLPFFSMVDRRRSLHLELMASARAEFPAILGTEVPYRSEIERMTVRRAPLPAGGAASEAALIYRQLWQQIVQQVQPASAAAPVNAATDARAVPAQPLAELPQHP